jgi:hypothetical protein
MRNARFPFKNNSIIKRDNYNKKYLETQEYEKNYRCTVYGEGASCKTSNAIKFVSLGCYKQDLQTRHLSNGHSSIKNCYEIVISGRRHHIGLSVKYRGQNISLTGINRLTCIGFKQFFKIL